MYVNKEMQQLKSPHWFGAGTYGSYLDEILIPSLTVCLLLLCLNQFSSIPIKRISVSLCNIVDVIMIVI